MTKKPNCFKCKCPIIQKYSLSKKGFTLKNSWDYWTENEKNKDKYICNSCLLNLYYNDKAHYLQEVQSPKKRAIFRVYVHNKTIS